MELDIWILSSTATKPKPRRKRLREKIKCRCSSYETRLQVRKQEKNGRARKIETDLLWKSRKTCTCYSLALFLIQSATQRHIYRAKVYKLQQLNFCACISKQYYACRKVNVGKLFVAKSKKIFSKNLYYHVAKLFSHSFFR